MNQTCSAKITALSNLTATWMGKNIFLEKLLGQKTRKKMNQFRGDFVKLIHEYI